MSFRVRLSTAVLGVGVIAIVATGCSSSIPSAAPTDTGTAAAAIPTAAATIKPGDSDTSAAAICGQFSAFFTVEANATTGAKKGTISATVEAAELSSIVTGMKNAASSDAGVHAAQTTLAAALASANTTAPGLPYDPNSTAYRSARDQLSHACIAAGTKITEYASVGG